MPWTSLPPQVPSCYYIFVPLNIQFDKSRSNCLLYLHSTHVLLFEKILGPTKTEKCSDQRINFINYVPLFLCGCSRWRVDPWSPCSATCGGGSQTRSVRCMKGPESRSRGVGSQYCHGTGRRPSNTRLCNQLPCSRWATTHWGLVSLHCDEAVYSWLVSLR